MGQKNESELERFAASFADEERLRRAVILLLEGMPHVRGVRDTHGNAEIGKDIVFETEGPFGQTSVHACVLKNLQIKGAVSSNRGAREVYFQVEQSLDTPIPRVSDGIPQQVTTVWVVSPYESQLPATISIAGKLSTNKDRIRFLCGSDLLREFKRWYPEYLMFDAGGFGQIAASVITTLDHEDAVGDALRLYGMSTLPGTLRAQYIPPNLAKYLDHFSLSVILPPVDKLPQSLKKSQADQLARDLVVTGRLVGQLSAMIGSQTRCAELSNQLAEEIKQAWNEGFTKQRSLWQRQFGKLPKEKQPPPPSQKLEAVLLEGRSFLDSKSVRLLREYKRSLVSVEQLLTEANKHASTSAFRKRLPSARALKTYCLVEDMSYAFSGSVIRKRNPNDILDLDRTVIESDKLNLLIAAPPGTGKTSYCKWKAIEDLERLRQGKATRVPQYVPLYRLNGRDLSAFEPAFLQDPQLAELWRERKSNRWSFRFYLDGLDELADATLQERVLQIALDAKKEEKSLSIVVTGRDYISAPSLRHFLRISVQKFDDPQLADFIDGWFKTDDRAKLLFEEELKLVPVLRELIRVPLLGTLVLKAYQVTQSLPGSLVKLYEIFIELLAGGWDLAKKVNRGSAFGRSVKITVLANLADRLHEARLREFEESEFGAAVKEVLPTYTSRSHELLGEICRDGLIVAEGKYYAFLHHSFQEYLAATHLTQPGGDKARRAIRRYLSGDDWWAEVVKFYLALSPTPQESRRFVERAAYALHSRIQPVIVEPRVKELLNSLALAYPGSSA